MIFIARVSQDKNAQLLHLASQSHRIFPHSLKEVSLGNFPKDFGTLDISSALFSKYTRFVLFESVSFYFSNA